MDCHHDDRTCGIPWMFDELAYLVPIPALGILLWAMPCRDKWLDCQKPMNNKNVADLVYDHCRGACYIAIKVASYYLCLYIGLATHNVSRVWMWHSCVFDQLGEKSLFSIFAHGSMAFLKLGLYTVFWIYPSCSLFMYIKIGRYQSVINIGTDCLMMFRTQHWRGFAMFATSLV